MTARGACSRYGECTAQLCPLAAGSLAAGRWFPDEEVCASPPRPLPRWMKMQRLVAARTGGDFARGYFTHAMLEAMDQVRPSVQGIDPDADRCVQEARLADWLRARRRRPRQVLSPEARARLAEKGRTALRAWRQARQDAAAARSRGEHAPEAVAAASGLPGQCQPGSERGGLMALPAAAVRA